MDESTRSHDAAFKALTTHLVQKHRKESSTLDALSLFFEESARDYTSASHDDIADILKLLLGQHPTFVIIDGIKEAHEPSQFLHRLHTICGNLDTKLILLTRPTIKLPPMWCQGSKETSCAIALGAKDNRADIKFFFDKELKAMTAQGLFGNRFQASDSTNMLATKADGMFLWAWLLVKYLHCDALTPQERKNALSYVNLLEGLDSLYEGILAVISRGYQSNIRMVASMFRWISCALYPLSTSTMHTALAIEAGYPTTPAHYLCDYPSCLPSITGALVEVSEGRPMFIHSSLRDYLESQRSSRFPELSLYNKAPCHAYLAAQCFSYIAHDAPKQPLYESNIVWGGLFESPQGLDTMPINADGGVNRKTPSSENIELDARRNAQPVMDSHRLRTSPPFFPTSESRSTKEAAMSESSRGLSPNYLLPPSKAPQTGTKSQTSEQQYYRLPNPQATCEVGDWTCRAMKKRQPGHPSRNGISYTRSTSNRKDDSSSTELFPQSKSCEASSQLFERAPHASLMSNASLRQWQRAVYTERYSAKEADTDGEQRYLRTVKFRSHERTAVDQLPFLSYAALACFKHLKQCVEERQAIDMRTGMLYAREPWREESRKTKATMIYRDASWVPVLSQFIMQSRARTVWVETCYTFRYSPDLDNILPIFDLLQDYATISDVDGREIWWLRQGLHQLSHALKQLRAQHRDMLIERPSFLWSNRLTMANDPEYWPNWTPKQVESRS